MSGLRNERAAAVRCGESGPLGAAEQRLLYHVTREKGTEPPFTGRWLKNPIAGRYHCICCGRVLFASGDKFDSGTGWPSFTKPVSPEALAERADFGLNMVRTEVVCGGCDAHLGHVFADGPGGRRRYCINSIALGFTASGAES